MERLILFLITFLIIIYILYLSPGLSNEFVHVFNNPIVKLILFIGMIALIMFNHQLGLLFLIALGLTYGFAEYAQMTEQFVQLAFN